MLGHPDRAAGENSRDLNRRRFFHDSGGQNALFGHSRVFLTAYQEPPGGDFLGSGHSHGGQGQLFAAGEGVHALGQDHEALGKGDRFAAMSAGHGVAARQQHLAGALHFQIVAALLAADFRDFRAGNFSRRGFQLPAKPGVFHARGQGDGALQGGAQLHDFVGNAGQVQQLQLFTAGEAILAHAFQRNGQAYIGELSAAQEGGLAQGGQGVGKSHGLQIFTVLEGGAADGGHALPQDHQLDLIPVLRPGCAGGNKARHVPGAGDSQVAGRVQAPGQALTAGAGGCLPIQRWPYRKI